MFYRFEIEIDYYFLNEFAVPIPYILIFGGTDINQLHTDEDKLCKMSRAVEGARLVFVYQSPFKIHINSLKILQKNMFKS